ncbi:MAG: hypothetical protein FWE02_06485 [Defluviitaleaceae bacterium]|nr:hypothetical protein [Defluviitaleaceae bacterium]
MYAIKEIFEKYVLGNMIWKAFALFFAVVLWTIIMNEVNPIEVVPFSRPLEIRGLSRIEAEGVVLLNQIALANTRTAVEISFRQNINITDNEVVTFIDLSELNLEEITSVTGITVPVLYEVNTAFSENEFAVNVSRQVTLQLDRIETISFPVHVNIEGELAYGLDFSGRATPTPSYISVTGPTSDLEMIHVILINLNAEEITEDYADSHNFIVVDEAGANITNRFSFDSDTVFLSMGLTRSNTVPIIAPTFTGSAAPGFTMGTFSVSMSSARIHGKPLAVSEISQLNLGEISISGLTENTIFTIDLRNLLPEDVSIEGEYLVTIYVNINSVIPPIVPSETPPIDDTETEDEVTQENEEDEIEEGEQEDEIYELPIISEDEEDEDEEIEEGDEI